jgi:bacillithiol biosynthesis cysteine-adding enzyme BshC
VAQPFTPAWLANEPSAIRLLDNPLSDLDTAAARVVAARRSAAMDRTPVDVLQVLRAQESARPQSAARTRSLDKLADGAFVVATGQQVGLFLGPLYAVHKAASAVAWARHLEGLLGHPVVPLFWLQTEDADFDEVRSAHLPGPDGLLTASLVPDTSTDGRPLTDSCRVSLGQRLIGAQISATFDQIAPALTGAHADAVKLVLERCYGSGRTLGEAAGDLIAELFADQGLLVFDPRPARGASPASTQAFVDTMRFSLECAAAIESTLTTRATELEAAGYDVQVKVREHVALACLHPDGPTADRFRLVRSGAEDHWTLSGAPGRFTTAELTQLPPAHISTTALLRPLLQDRLFPTIAYVGGPGEIAYFSELPPLYELAGLPMPMVIPRARIQLSTPASRRLTNLLGLPADAWRLGESELRQHLLGTHTELAPLDALTTGFTGHLDHTFDALRTLANQLGDNAFAKQADKARDQIDHAMTRLIERLRRTALERNDEERHRLTRLLALIRPNDAPQERVLAFVTFAAQLGPNELITKLVTHIESLLAPGADPKTFATAREVHL